MTQPRRALLALLVVSNVLIAQSVLGAPPEPPPDQSFVVGGFEVDGNLVDESPDGEPSDWDTLPADQKVLFDDPDGNEPDNVFTTGGSKELTPGTWRFIEDGSAPSKNDIVEGGIGLRQFEGDDWLYLYSVRDFEGGSAFLDYEFNANPGTWDNDADPTTPEIPFRTAGDLLVFIEITQGGATTTIDVFVWDGNEIVGTWVAPTIDPIPVEGVDWAAVTEPINGNKFLLSEAALKLQAFDQEPSCPGLGKAWIKTISSAQFETAVLKDRTERSDVDLDNCASITVNKISDQTNGPLGGAEFTAFLSEDDVFDAGDVAAGTCVTDVNGTCTIDALPAGTYFVQETSPPDGYAADPEVRGPFELAPKQDLVLTDPFVNHFLEPAFTVDKEASSATSTVDGSVTYTVTVTNVGDGPGSTPVVDDYDQDHVTVSAISGGGVDDGDTITWDSGTLAANGGQATFTYVATFNGPFSGDPSAECEGGKSFGVVNTVTVTGDSDTETVCVLAEPKFDVDKDVSSNTSAVDGTVTYTVTVTNIGDADGTTPVEDDYDQDHVTVSNITGGGFDDGDTITWSSGILSPGEDVVFTYDATFKGPFTGLPSAGCGADEFGVVNLVTVDGDSDTETVCVAAFPEFDVDKAVSSNTSGVNGTVTYTVTVTNIGDAPGSTPAVDDYEQDHVTISNISGGGVDDGDTITWDSGVLGAGGSIVFTYDATFNGPFEGEEDCDGGFAVINLVTVTGDTDTETVCVAAEPKFDVDKDVSSTTSEVDGTVTYTVTVTNIGDAQGSTPVVDDYDQDHVTVSNISGGGVDNGDTITWDSGVLAAGASTSFTYDATFKGPFEGEQTCEGGFGVLNSVTVDGDSDSETVCVAAEPKFDVDKTVSSNTSGVDGTVTYTVTVTNIGDAQGSTLAVDDYDQDHVTVSAISGGGVDDGDTITWDSGLLAAGDSVVFTYDATFKGPFTGEEDCDGGFAVINLVTVTGDTDTETVCVAADPKFDVDKTVSSNTSEVDGTVTYTITVTNIGDAPGSTPAVDDYDQDHVTVSNISGGGVDDGDTITWDSGVLGAGDSIVFTYDATFNGPFEGASDCEGGFAVINGVTVDGDSDSETVCVAAEPKFDVVKDVSSSTSTVDGTVTYTVTVTNIGDAPGSTPAVDDYDQDHVTISNISGGGVDNGDTITWDSGVLAAGESVIFTYDATFHGPFNGVPAPGCTGVNEFPVVNLVTVTGDSDGETVCVTADPAFDAEKTAATVNDPAAPGDVISYTITVTNTGDGPGTTPVVDTYDERLTVDEASISDGGVHDPVNHTITWTAGPLDPGETATFTFDATIPATIAGERDAEGPCAGSFGFVNDVTVEGDSDSTITCVVAEESATFVKEVRNLTDDGAFGSSTTADPGEQVEYRITYTNTGAADATNVTVTDPVPAQTTFVSCEPMLSCSEADGVVTWNLGTVPTGQSAEATFVVQLDATFPDGITTIANVATVDTDRSDPAPSNEALVFVTVLDKDSCPEETVAPGGAIEYHIPWGVHGRDLTGVTITDTLPAGFRYESATPAPDQAPAEGESGVVVWNFGTVAAGTTDEAVIFGTVAPSANGTTLTNTVEIVADGVPATTSTDDTAVTTEGSSQSSRAFGARVELLDTEIIGPTPDSDVENPDSVLSLPDNELVEADVLSVQEGGSVDDTGANSNAIATTAQVRIIDTWRPGHEDWAVTATAVRAVSSSAADVGNAYSSRAGTVLTNVTVDGKNLGDVKEPTSIEIIDPVLGTKTIVKLIETIPSGAAAGVEQPDGSMFSSGLEVNAIHVTVLGPGQEGVIADVIVGHAESSATFVSGLACGEELPRVSGTGFVVGANPDETLLDDTNTLVDGEVGRVLIPVTGGEDTATVAHVGPVTRMGDVVIESNTAFAHSEGVIDGNTASADTEAQVEDLDVLDQNDAPEVEDFLLTADLIRAESHSEASSDDAPGTSTGDTTIAGLFIDGNDVCAALMLESTCTPEPNTEIVIGDMLLVILNEQIPGPTGNGVSSLTVNAVHIFVLGEGNPLGLPVSSEIIVSSAHSGASTAGGDADITPDPENELDLAPAAPSGTGTDAAPPRLPTPALPAQQPVTSQPPTRVSPSGVATDGPTPAAAAEEPADEEPAAEEPPGLIPSLGSLL